MIVFDLKCGAGHVFEAWFNNSDSYAAQAAAGQLACPSCGNSEVVKAPMAPNIATGVQAPEKPAVPAAAAPAAMHAAYAGQDIKAHFKRFLEEVKTHVEENFDYVGKEFAEEARKIHYGEEAARPIYGEATPAESAALRDEGIDFLELPFPRKSDA